MPKVRVVTTAKYRWYGSGDVNAFFGLMLDNIAGLILLVETLTLVFQFEPGFVIRYMVPGTAIGVFVGDLLFFWLALRVAKRTQVSQLTAMPLGLDTPSTFGMIFFVLGPAFLAKKAMLTEDNGEFSSADLLAAQIYAWKIGISSIFMSGIFKIVCSFGSAWIRDALPRAGLLGSLASIALVLISFVPLLEVLQVPSVGLLALAIILTTLVAKIDLPWKIPGALGAVVVSASIYYLMVASDHFAGTHLLHVSGGSLPGASENLLPTEWLSAFTFGWTDAFTDSLKFLPIVIPLAIGTVIGGIDCTESAAAAGDEYSTNQVIGIEAIATLVASLCGGVIQTTPYIGHPAYKAMGGRAAYTLATALFVGLAGTLGFFGFVYLLLPKFIVFPILVFIGIEITAQSFHATPHRHYPAVAFACIPALAVLANLFIGKLMGDPAIFGANVSEQSLGENLQHEILTIRVLSSGFIITSLLWASGLAMLIDRKLAWASVAFATCGLFTFFGIIHSPFSDGSMFFPWKIQDSKLLYTVLQFAFGYLFVAIALLLWSYIVPQSESEANAAS